MRLPAALAIVLSLALVGCAGCDAGLPVMALAPVPSLPAATAAAAPVGLWPGGMTILVSTTRNPESAPTFFGAGRSPVVSEARMVLFPATGGMLASVNPAASKNGWRIAGVEPLANAGPQAIAAAVEGRDVLVYVHGFNETFASSAESYARLIAGIDYRGAPVLFAWPSRGAVLDYVTDRDTALWSRDALEATIDALIGNPKVRRVHVLAHSMGGTVALEALRSIMDRTGGLVSDRFGAIVLANPDVDLDVFRRQTARLGPLTDRMTVIVSAKDRALGLSSRLAGGLPRVGAADSASLKATGVSVVDASEFGSGFLNHDLFVSDPDVAAAIGRAIEDRS